MRKAIVHLKKVDPVMAAIIDRAGPYEIQYREPTFQTLVRSIVYQQLSGKAALTIFNRLLEAARAAGARAARAGGVDASGRETSGTGLGAGRRGTGMADASASGAAETAADGRGSDGARAGKPGARRSGAGTGTVADELTPEAILALRPSRMRALGLSKQKLTYIRELARMTRKGEVDFALLAEWEDPAVIEHLTRVKGVGVWTVHMFLIFALRRTNVLPTGDLGVRAAIKKAYGLAELPKPAEMEKIAAAWHPYCSVATWYLWRSLDNQGAM